MPKKGRIHLGDAIRFAWMRARVSPRNPLRGRRYRREVLESRAPLADLTRYERRVHSQNGEDGILEAIFARIGVTTRACVEFGVEDGSECLTRRLTEEDGWRALLMDGSHENPTRNLRRAFITAENIEALLEAGGAPRDVDLLCIDIDGNDYWVWRAIGPEWTPRVVVVEYNAQLGPTRAATIPYDPEFHWDQTDYFGASLAALVQLGREKGYTLVACDSFGVNAFFVQDALARAHFVPTDPARLYRAPRHGRHAGGHLPHPTLVVPDLAMAAGPAGEPVPERAVRRAGRLPVGDRVVLEHEGALHPEREQVVDRQDA
jgi:hypothetical protein